MYMSKSEILSKLDEKEELTSDQDPDKQKHNSLSEIEIYQAPVLIRFGNLALRIEQNIDLDTKVTTGLNLQFFSDDIGDELKTVSTLSSVNRGEKKNVLLLKLDDLYVLPICDEVLEFVEEHEGEMKEIRDLETYGTTLLQ